MSTSSEHQRAAAARFDALAGQPLDARSKAALSEARECVDLLATSDDVLAELAMRHTTSQSAPAVAALAMIMCDRLATEAWDGTRALEALLGMPQACSIEVALRHLLAAVRVALRRDLVSGHMEALRNVARILVAALQSEASEPSKYSQLPLVIIVELSSHGLLEKVVSEQDRALMLACVRRVAVPPEGDLLHVQIAHEKSAARDCLEHSLES